MKIKKISWSESKTIITTAVVIILLFSLWMTYSYFDYVWGNKETLVQSFMASLYEDLLFFVVVGIAVIAYQRTQPDKDPFEKRITYLFNNRDLNETARLHITKKLKSMSGYRESTRTHIAINEYDIVRNAYRINVKRFTRMINMVSDAQHEDEIRIGLIPDKLCPPVAGKIGELLHVNLHVHEQDKEEKHPGPEEIPQSGKKFSIPFSIPEGKSAEYETCYWWWASSDIPLKLTNVHFVEHASVTFENMMTHPVSISMRKHGEDNGNPDDTIRIIQGNRHELLRKTDMVAGEAYDFTIHPPQIDNCNDEKDRVRESVGHAEVSTLP